MRTFTSTQSKLVNTIHEIPLRNKMLHYEFLFVQTHAIVEYLISEIYVNRVSVIFLLMFTEIE
jgi:hypothetical protein